MANDKPAVRRSAELSKNLIQWFDTLRSFFISFTVVALIIAMIMVVVQELQRDSVVMEPITLPDVLIKRGFTSVGTSHWLSNHISRISEAAATTKNQNSFQDQDAEVEIVVPGSGISLQSVTKALRAVFGLQQTRVAGEVICNDNACSEEKMELRLRVFDKNGMVIIPVGTFGDVLNQDFDGAGMEPYFEAAAIKVLEYLDPYIVAAYQFQTKKTGARDRAIAMVRANHADRAWAANLIGLMDMRAGDFDSSDFWLDRAIKFSQEDKILGFARPMATYGYSLHRRGQIDEALEVYATAMRTDPTYANVHYLVGLSYIALDAPQKALEAFKKAANLDPGSSRSFHQWAKAAAELGRNEVAEKQYSKSAQVGPLRMELYPDWYDFRVSVGTDPRDTVKAWSVNLELLARDLVTENCSLLLEHIEKFATYNNRLERPWQKGEFLEEQKFCEEEINEQQNNRYRLPIR